MGSLAVIGPTRIDYQHTMTAVSAYRAPLRQNSERIGVATRFMGKTNGKSKMDPELDLEHELPPSDDTEEAQVGASSRNDREHGGSGRTAEAALGAGHSARPPGPPASRV